MLAICAPPPVGFIWHYPFVDGGNEALGAVGADTMVARAPWGAIEPEPGRFELGCLEQQLQVAERAGFRLVLLLECNPFCSPQWLRQEVHSAGECTADADGSDRDHMPRAESPTFLTRQAEFLERVIRFVRERDTRRAITHYQAGVEWWFPHSFRYAEADIARFRKWLAVRHGGLEGINGRWRSSFASLDQVPAPRVTVLDLWRRGREGLAPVGLADPAQRGAIDLAAATADFDSYWQERAAETVEAHAARVRSLDPTRPIVSFLTLTFAYGAEWDYTQWSAMAPDVVARHARSTDVFGMQLPVAFGDAYRVTFGLDLVRKYGRPMWALDLVDFPAGVAGSQRAMAQASLSAVQHGASGLFYCCWTGAKDYDFWPTWPTDGIGDLVRTTERALVSARGMLVRPTMALIHTHVPASPDDAAGWRNDPGSFMGWYRLLEELHETPDVVTLGELESGSADLGRYRWALVPDCAVLPVAALRRLAEYARSGGCVVWSGRVPETDEAGRRLPADAVGWLQRVPHVDDLGRAYMGRMVRDSHAGDTPPMFPMPAADSEPPRLARECARIALSRLRPHGQPAPPFRLNPALPQVTAVPFEQRGWAGLFLVNRGNGPVGGLRVTVGGPAPRRCTAEVDGVLSACAPRRMGRDAFEVFLPGFELSCVVRWLPASGGGGGS